MSEKQIIRDRYAIYNADTVDVARALESDSVDYSIFSPPFASLFTYSPSPRDLGNCTTYEEFWEHYRFLAREQFRVMAPGRVMSVHCMDLPTSKVRDDVVGLRDFPGDLIREYVAAGFIYHSRVTIWKDPVTAMQRTKALGLLHKTIRKDSSMSRQGVADYLISFRKPGTNAKPIEHTNETFPVERWQRYASPVWASVERVDDEGFLVCTDKEDPNDAESGIDQTDTLNAKSAREHEDERHLCPLQLGVIRRGIRLWSRPDDVVWSPFLGIGSEGVIAIEEGRRFVGAELKASYFKQAAANIANATTGGRQASLFSEAG